MTAHWERTLSSLREGWAKARPLIEQALARSNPDGVSIEAIEATLFGGQAQLWGDEKTAAVTQVNGELVVWFLAGQDSEIENIDASATAWARKMGLSRITIRRTRKGWARRLASLGYKSETVLTKEL